VGISLQTILLDLDRLVDHLAQGVGWVTREGKPDASVQPLAIVVHLGFLLSDALPRCIPHHAGEAGGVLLDPLRTLGDVTELVRLGVHGTLRNVVLTELRGELIPRDVRGVVVGVAVAVPPSACSARELVSGDPNTLLVGASGQVEFLLHLSKPVLGSDGIAVGTIEGRGPELEKALQLPLEVVLLTSMAVHHVPRQGLQ
jgi:hypothetical protein